MSAPPDAHAEVDKAYRKAIRRLYAILLDNIGGAVGTQASLDKFTEAVRECRQVRDLAIKALPPEINT
jgi:hypothetical protein